MIASYSGFILLHISPVSLSLPGVGTLIYVSQNLGLYGSAKCMYMEYIIL